MTGGERHPRIDRLPGDGPIHAVGAAGLETASMVRYLVEGGRDDIVLHDAAEDFDSAFWAAHRLQPVEHRARSQAALARCRELRGGPDHLADVETAAALLLPVSWFLHPANARLQPLRDRFVLYPDACFDLWQGPVIGVTGSFGKTTTTASPPPWRTGCSAATTGRRSRTWPPSPASRQRGSWRSRSPTGTCATASGACSMSAC